jgi:hypothetical protein
MRPLRSIGCPALGLLCVLFALAADARTAHAGSVFSIGGLGEPSLEESARLRAMGGGGAAEHGPTRSSFVNPASLAETRHLFLEASMVAQTRKVTTASFGDESPHETTFPSVRLGVYLPFGVVLGAGYLLGTSADFHVERAESSGAASKLEIDGRGGIDFVRVSLARRFTSELRGGIDLDVIGGSYHEEWTRSFSDPDLARSRDTLEVAWDRLMRWRFGAQYVRPRLAFGAVYETGRRLPLTERQRTTGSETLVTGRSLAIPDGFALGAEAGVGERMHLVGQYRRENWSAESLQSDLVGFRAEERYSLGLEIEPRGGRSPFSRLPIRVGASYLRWPDLLPPAGASDVSGGSAEVNEWAVSLGTGLRTQDGSGALDLALEGGRRGDLDTLGARETFFRLALSLRVSDETWK